MVNASPSRKLVDAKELITCGICTSVYRHPLMLPCQHTFCFQCIVKSCRYYIAYSNGFNIDSLRENYQDSLACALCMQLVTFPRGVITKLPKNHVILELLEKSGYKNGLILNQKQIHQILTDVSTLWLIYNESLLLFRINNVDIRLDCRLNQTTTNLDHLRKAVALILMIQPLMTLLMKKLQLDIVENWEFKLYQKMTPKVNSPNLILMIQATSQLLAQSPKNILLTAKLM